MPVYLYLILFTVSFPLFLSFDNNVKFIKKWKAFFLAMPLPALLFLVWDYFFTLKGIWGFNPEYLLGYYFLNLPMEEVLFFLVVPFACIFIYECLNFYVKKDYLKNYTSYINWVLISVLFIVAIFNLEKLYTAINFLGCVTVLLLLQLWLKPTYLSRFYVAFIVILIPFFIVNGILTYLPVVWYNNEYNLGIRMVSIPIEDTAYNLFKLLSYLIPYEYFKSRLAKAN